MFKQLDVPVMTAANINLTGCGWKNVKQPLNEYKNSVDPRKKDCTAETKT